MKIPATLLFAAALIAPASVPAATFEGKVTMKIAGPRDLPPQMLFSLKPGFARIDLSVGPGQSVAVLFDSAKATTSFLMLDQQMFLAQPMPTPPTGAALAGGAAGAAVEITTTREKLLGYDCVKYIARAKDGDSEIWVTDQLGSFLGFPSGNPMDAVGGGGRAAPAPQGWETALLGKGVFPLKIVTMHHGRQIFRLEATAVEKVALPASTFTVPAGFQNLSQMMQGIPGLPGGMKLPGGN